MKFREEVQRRCSRVEVQRRGPEMKFRTEDQVKNNPTNEFQ
jgi:hypothetical protein